MLEIALENPVTWRLVIAALIPFSFYCGFRFWRRARLIADLPTSRIRSAAQGYVEIMGRAKLTPGNQVMAPLSNRPCVWWNYRIEEYRQSGRSSRWVSIEGATSVAPFLLEDDSGVCLVHPLNAEVFPDDSVTWRGSTRRPLIAGNEAGFWSSRGEYRYTEHRINEFEMVNAIGQFTTVGGAQSVDTAEAVAQLISDWKRDQPTLLTRFDSNHDGVLDQKEWELARAQARLEVTGGAVNPTAPQFNVLAKPDDDRPLLIASGNFRHLVRRYRWMAGGALLIFVMLSGVLTALLID